MIKQLDSALHRTHVHQSDKLKTHKALLGRFIGDFIYGANDGIITTFAIVAGAAGANLPHFVIAILGLSNIVADGLSMGASNYLGNKSEQDYAKHQREREKWEIKHMREDEIEEVRDIYRKKGFKGKDLETAVAIITSNEKVWLDTMMKEELSIMEESEDPKKTGLATFGAFVIAGFVPLLPFLIPGIPNPFAVSVIGAGVTLFIVGALRSYVTTISFLRGGLEMFVIGAVSSSAAYIISGVVEGLIR